MRSRILSLWLPDLAIDRRRRRARRAAARPDQADPAWRPDLPLATFAADRGALRLVAVCPQARAAGLGPGLMLTDARARLPELQVQADTPEADARLLDELARWCERYTPHVAVDRSQAGDPVNDQGGALWLDITGCAHLFDGEARLGADLLGRLHRQGFAAQAAIADHPGSAWAVARHGSADRDQPAIVPPGGARVALAALPVAALRLEPAQVQMLGRLGLSRIDSLYPLPRQALAARFGDGLVRRLDQALGRLDEPIAPRPPRPAHRVERLLAEPIVTIEVMERLARRLLQELCAGLEAAGVGVRRLTLAGYRVDGGVVSVVIGTSRPTRDPRPLARLLAEKLTRLDPGFGIERLILVADVVEPLLPEPIAWRAMGAGDLDQARDLAPLVDRLGNRLGANAVTRLVPQASHLPERAQRRVPALHEDGAPAFAGRSTCRAGPSRPLRLLARPEPIEAMAPLPDEPPVLFRWRRALHQVVRVDGPERLAPEWWRTPDLDPGVATRDYFAVEDAEGGRFWLFREGLYLAATATLPRWYLHGLFA